ncbi:hypothetical protein IAQ61_000552 [Plenodomus lingam]|uniref:uncharacterized protein n=1 Tax=Leptosphaeria maculans TaxID=5022 RepID=UPI003331CBE3|nr:hypothetical protein IAQ61_000552 [Plenodomus lingam]
MNGAEMNWKMARDTTSGPALPTRLGRRGSKLVTDYLVRGNRRFITLFPPSPAEVGSIILAGLTSLPHTHKGR